MAVLSAAANVPLTGCKCKSRMVHTVLSPLLLGGEWPTSGEA